MEYAKRLLVADTSDEFRRHLIEALQNESDMEVVGETGDGQQLLDEEQHLSYLDRFGRTETPLGRYQAAYSTMAELQSKIRALQMDEAEKARRMDSLRFQIDELERAQLKAGQDEELSARKAKWVCPEPRIKTGYLARYAKMVSSADRGAVLE